MARYIERHPIKVGLVGYAEDYRWSSAKAHLTLAQDDLLQEPSWLQETDRSRYAEFILNSDKDAKDKLHSATRTGRPLGSENFIDNMEYQLNATLRPRKQGRPRKTWECS